MPAFTHTGDSMPGFSIIISTHNRCNLVLATLASLRRQTLSYERFEVIIVDCASTDGTLDAVRSYISASSRQNPWRVKCFSLRDGRRSRSYARMRGVQAAAGEVLVFLDDDTLPDPHFLERLALAYREIGADAIGGRTTLRCEHPRPSWLTADMLALLGHFAPGEERMPLPTALSFSSCCFSVKAAALHSIGDFTLFTSAGEVYIPPGVEVAYLCRRLRQTGYQLWYEPAALAVHGISVARLWHRFFLEQAYWQGRAEVVLRYLERAQSRQEEEPPVSLDDMARDARCDISELARTACFRLPSLLFAGRSMSDPMQVFMALARAWGDLQQRLLLLQHEPATTGPAVLLVCGQKRERTLLARGLSRLHVRCHESSGAISISWLWRHRAHHGRPLALIHLYRPGSLGHSPWARQRLLLLLRLAQYLGIRIVTTDAGGWWQVGHGLSTFQRRAFERSVLASSDVVLTSSAHPEQLYTDKLLRRRVRALPQPGFRGYYPRPLGRQAAYAQLGIPARAEFVYLCFAGMHSEREIVQLVEAFFEAAIILQGRQPSWSPATAPRLQLPQRSSSQAGAATAVAQHKDALQLLLVGAPGDKRLPAQVLQRAARDATIHLFMEAREEDMALYLGAAHAIVMPHFPSPAAGALDTAMLALSYERIVIAPDLPRFRDLLPGDASVLYDPFSRTSLANALSTAPTRGYRLTEEGMRALDAEESWREHAERLVRLYKQLLRP